LLIAGSCPSVQASRDDFVSHISNSTLAPRLFARIAAFATAGCCFASGFTTTKILQIRFTAVSSLLFLAE
jgi:hypothetical protein